MITNGSAPDRSSDEREAEAARRLFTLLFGDDAEAVILGLLREAAELEKQPQNQDALSPCTDAEFDAAMRKAYRRAEELQQDNSAIKYSPLPLVSAMATAVGHGADRVLEVWSDWYSAIPLLAAQSQQRYKMGLSAEDKALGHPRVLQLSALRNRLVENGLDWVGDKMFLLFDNGHLSVDVDLDPSWSHRDSAEPALIVQLGDPQGRSTEIRLTPDRPKAAFDVKPSDADMPGWRVTLIGALHAEPPNL